MKTESTSVEVYRPRNDSFYGAKREAAPFMLEVDQRVSARKREWT